MHYSTLRGVVRSVPDFHSNFSLLPCFYARNTSVQIWVAKFSYPALDILVKNSELESLVLRNMEICSPQCSLSHLIQASAALNRTSTILSHMCNIELPLGSKSLHIRKKKNKKTFYKTKKRENLENKETLY